MARLARAMPHRPVITGFVPPPAPPNPIIPAPFIIRSIVVADTKRRYKTLPKRATLPLTFNIPPSSPYLRITKAISTARRYQILPKRALIPKFVEPVKPTIIVRSTAISVARRVVVPRRHILPLPFNVPPSSPNVIRSIRIAVAISRARPRKPIIFVPAVPPAIPIVPPANIIRTNRIAEALRRAKPRKPILFVPSVPPAPYIPPVVTYVIKSTAKAEARRQAGPRKRPVLYKPANPVAAYIPPATVYIVHTARLATIRRYLTKAKRPLLAPFVPTTAGTIPQIQQQLFWGRFARGQHLNVILNIDQLPDDVPTVTYWLEGTTELLTESMPIIKSPNKTFFIRKLMDNNFDDGHYAAVMEYVLSGRRYAAIGYFQVQGGIGTAPITALMEIERGLGRAVVSASEDGSVSIGYKPRRMLP